MGGFEVLWERNTSCMFPSIATKVAAPKKVVAQHIFLMLTYNYNKPFGFEDKVEKLAAH